MAAKLRAMVGFCVLLAIPTMAWGWQMDTDLGGVDASFLGEAYYDMAGAAVADAGDINNDGYRDFIVGAYGSDAAANSAGQTYIFLGGGAWGMDEPMTSADGSYIGESSWDYSGYTLAGAGDVDGDGYDDFLIGAVYASELGN